MASHFGFAELVRVISQSKKMNPFFVDFMYGETTLSEAVNMQNTQRWERSYFE